MELKINLDTKAIAEHIVVSMIQNLHQSVVSFTQQKFGALNQRTGQIPFSPLFHDSGFLPPMFSSGIPNHLPIGVQQNFSGGFISPPQQLKTTEYDLLLNQLSVDEELIAKVDTLLSTYLFSQEFFQPRGK